LLLLNNDEDDDSNEFCICGTQSSSSLLAGSITNKATAQHALKHIATITPKQAQEQCFFSFLQRRALHTQLTWTANQPTDEGIGSTSRVCWTSTADGTLIYGVGRRTWLGIMDPIVQGD